MRAAGTRWHRVQLPVEVLMSGVCKGCDSDKIWYAVEPSLEAQFRPRRIDTRPNTEKQVQRRVNEGPCMVYVKHLTIFEHSLIDRY